MNIRTYDPSRTSIEEQVFGVFGVDSISDALGYCRAFAPDATQIVLESGCEMRVDRQGAIYFGHPSSGAGQAMPEETAPVLAVITSDTVEFSAVVYDETALSYPNPLPPTTPGRDPFSALFADE